MACKISVLRRRPRNGGGRVDRRVAFQVDDVLSRANAQDVLGRRLGRELVHVQDVVTVRIALVILRGEASHARDKGRLKAKGVRQGS